MEDDAVLVLGIRGCARYAQAHVPKRGSYHRVPRVPQGWLSRHEELVGLLGSAVDFFQESYQLAFLYLCFYKSLLWFLRTPPPLRQTLSYELVAVTSE